MKEEGEWNSISFPPAGAAVWQEVAFCSALFIRAVHHFPARSLWPLSCSELCTSSSMCLRLAPHFWVGMDVTYHRSSLC